MFTEYRDYLDHDFNHGFWDDQGMTIAGEFLEKFTADDWECLSSAWSSQRAAWKIRCAETLDIVLADESFAILLSMAVNPDRELAMTALDSLRSFSDSPEVQSIRRAWKPDSDTQSGI